MALDFFFSRMAFEHSLKNNITYVKSVKSYQNDLVYSMVEIAPAPVCMMKPSHVIELSPSPPLPSSPPAPPTTKSAPFGYSDAIINSSISQLHGILGTHVQHKKLLSILYASDMNINRLVAPKHTHPPKKQQKQQQHSEHTPTTDNHQ